MKTGIIAAKPAREPPPEMSRTPATAPRRVPYANCLNFSTPFSSVNFQPSQSVPVPLIAVS